MTFDLGAGELLFVDPRRFGTGELALGRRRRSRRSSPPGSGSSRSRPSSPARTCTRSPGAAGRRSRRCCSTRSGSRAWATSTPTRRSPRVHPLRHASQLHAQAVRGGPRRGRRLAAGRDRGQGRDDRRLPRPDGVSGTFQDRYPPARGRAVPALRARGAQAARRGARDLRLREVPAEAALRRRRSSSSAARGRPQQLAKAAEQLADDDLREGHHAGALRRARRGPPASAARLISLYGDLPRVQQRLDAGAERAAVRRVDDDVGVTSRTSESIARPSMGASLQDRGDRAALDPLRRGGSRSCTSTRPTAAASARSPRACGGRSRASAGGSSRSPACGWCCTEGRGDLCTISQADTVDAHRRLRERRESLDTRRPGVRRGRCGCFDRRRAQPAGLPPALQRAGAARRRPGRTPAARKRSPSGSSCCSRPASRPQLAACAACGEPEHLGALLAEPPAGSSARAARRARSRSPRRPTRFLVEALGRPLAEAPAGARARPAPGRAGDRRDARAPRARAAARASPSARRVEPSHPLQWPPRRHDEARSTTSPRARARCATCSAARAPTSPR